MNYLPFVLIAIATVIAYGTLLWACASVSPLLRMTHRSLRSELEALIAKMNDVIPEAIRERMHNVTPKIGLDTLNKHIDLSRATRDLAVAVYNDRAAPRVALEQKIMALRNLHEILQSDLRRSA